MAFTLDDIVIDRIQMATAEKTDGTLLYTLTQLSEATIETTAENVAAQGGWGNPKLVMWDLNLAIGPLVA